MSSPLASPIATGHRRRQVAGNGERRDIVFRVIAVAASLGLVAFVVTVIVSSPASRATPATFPEPALPALAKGSQAPGFSLQRLGGGSDLDLSALRGSPVVLNFFASWCPDCQSELAGFARFAKSESRNVDVIGVDTNDSNTTGAMHLLERAGAVYPVGIDPLGSLALRYRIQALPVTYFIDSEGRIAGVAFGKLSSAQLDLWMRKLRLAGGAT
jgi:cytochrome c biogenesis protein CcmG, thiol:disulfide interchange protein DsbE